MFLVPVVTESKEKVPAAVLLEPVVLFFRDSVPIAVLLLALLVNIILS